jgi:predicted nucleic acid-binding protein
MILATPVKCVVDASVGVQLFVEQKYTKQAKKLFSHLESDQSSILYVPDLFYIECASALLKYVKSNDHEYSIVQAEQDLEELRDTRLRKTATYALAKDSLIISLSLELSVYDACYVALANRLSVPLVTNDGGLINKTKDSPYLVYSLKEVEIPEPSR